MESYRVEASGSGDVEEKMIEYERKVPFRGFSSKHLFPNEPPFKRGDGVWPDTPGCSASDIALLSKEGLLLPAGWRWAGLWRAQTGPGTDAEGWMYAFNWGVGSYAASGQANHFVRRRLWSRTRTCVAGERTHQGSADECESPAIVISMKEEEEQDAAQAHSASAPAVPPSQDSGENWWWWHRQSALRLLKSRNAKERIRQGGGGAGRPDAGVEDEEDEAMQLLQNRARGKAVTVMSNCDAHTHTHTHTHTHAHTHTYTHTHEHTNTRTHANR